MLKALQFIHELGICHCDVKPENICLVHRRDSSDLTHHLTLPVSPSPQVSASRNKFKLIDFGAATLEYDYRNSYVQSRWYRAPEVMLGLPWDEKVDVWSLGCVLVELVVGRPIFYGPAVEYVLAAQTAVLGDIPDRMMRASSLTRMYYTPDRQLYTVDPQVSRTLHLCHGGQANFPMACSNAGLSERRVSDSANAYQSEGTPGILPTRG